MSELKPEDKKLHRALNKAMKYDDFYDTILEAAQAKVITKLKAELVSAKDMLEEVQCIYGEGFSNIKQRHLCIRIREFINNNQDLKFDALSAQLQAENKRTKAL